MQAGLAPFTEGCSSRSEMWHGMLEGIVMRYMKMLTRNGHLGEERATEYLNLRSVFIAMPVPPNLFGLKAR